MPEHNLFRTVCGCLIDSRTLLCSKKNIAHNRSWPSPRQNLSAVLSSTLQLQLLLFSSKNARSASAEWRIPRRCITDSDNQIKLLGLINSRFEKAFKEADGDQARGLSLLADPLRQP